MKSRRVSWASGVNLCQVVPFLKEDCPSQVGLTARRNFRSMESVSAISNSALLKNLSCFWGKNSNHLQQSMSNINPACWTCPPKFSVSCGWHVTAGEESQEAGTQSLRELNVLEAVYPWVSAIPSSPAVSENVEQECYDDGLTSEIPLIPIDEMNKPDLEPTSLCTKTPEVPKQQLPSSAGLDAGFLAAASAACAALLKSSKKGSMIDPDLLVEIFNNPKLIEELLNRGGSPNGRKIVVPEPIPGNLQVPYSSLVCHPTLVTNVQSKRPFSSPSPHSVPVPSAGQVVNHSVPFSNGFSRPVDHIGTVRGTPNLAMVTQPFESQSLIPQHIPPLNLSHLMDRCSPHAMISSFDSPVPKPQEVLERVTRPGFPSDNVHRPGLNIKNPWPSVHKDTNYLKNLIREHGGLRQGNPERDLVSSHQNDVANPKTVNALILEEMNSKNNRKPCIFFNSPQGCHGGYDFPCQHDIGPDWDDGRNAKRAKLGVFLSGSRTNTFKRFLT